MQAIQDSASGDTLVRPAPGHAWRPLTATRVAYADVRQWQIAPDRPGFFLLGRRFVPFGLPLDRNPHEWADRVLAPVGIHEGVLIFADPEDRSRSEGTPLLVYVPAGPGCVLQAFTNEGMDRQARRQIPGVEPLEFERVSGDGYFVSDTPGSLVITDSATWAEFWARYWVPADGVRRPAAAIDFLREAVLAVGYGIQSSGCSELDPIIDWIERRADTVRVLVGFDQPLSTCRDVVAPLHVVVLERPRGPVLIVTPREQSPPDPGDWLAPLPPAARGAYPSMTRFTRRPEPIDHAVADRVLGAMLHTIPELHQLPERDRWIGFVVNESGRVEPSTLIMADSVTPQVRAAVARAVAEIQFHAAQLAGSPVKAWTGLRFDLREPPV